jgi:uncharacterized RDD family membrane protein YckC
LQDHWLRRLIAAIIDSIIMMIVARIIGLIIVLPTILQGGLFSLSYLDLLQGILLVFYAAVLESTWGATLGKQIMNLKVTTMDGRLPTLDRALIRNASKIYGLLLLIDLIVGMATIGDPHQKISDRYAGTTVVSTIQRSMILPTPSTSSPPP